MKRQRRTVGSILQVQLAESVFCYAQILDKQFVFFDYKSNKELLDSELDCLEKAAPLFYLSVYKDVVTKSRWLIKGKLALRQEFHSVPMQFIQDGELFELYNPNTGEITPATYEECKCLEYAATWEASHVEDRLRDHFNGVSNKWVESLKPKRN
ncbi:hypothetical protein [Pseudoalteromonas luteoviolacea]|uniref:hypothetical protein n=1 Tax=Pseudoalteromonas luteoviolacea TaxID=43657 RepID=UPI0011514D28|nr:hypothetical protein [Pseudoalteromonas luteoviolacea]TQF67821.1 hypothetical protein FLM44_21825 [Pseudoalteromonas luteoviolacea]